MALRRAESVARPVQPNVLSHPGAAEGNIEGGFLGPLGHIRASVDTKLEGDEISKSGASGRHRFPGVKCRVIIDRMADAAKPQKAPSGGEVPAKFSLSLDGLLSQITHGPDAKHLGQGALVKWGAIGNRKA